MEIWKEVEQTEGKYEISNYGNFRAKNSLKNIKGFITKFGYVYCNLRFKGQRKWIFRHRLVADAFLHKADPNFEVNHINGIKTDNRVENLEWCNRSHNVQHAYDTGLKKAKNGKNHKLARIVLDLNTGVFFDFAKEASIAYNVNYSTLVNMLNGTNKNSTNLIYV